MGKFKLGLDLSFAKKRWPEPELFIDIVRNQLGIKYLEFDSDFVDPLYLRESSWKSEAARINKLAKDAGLEIHNYFTGTMTHCVNLLSHPRADFREDGMIWCEKALEVATALGTRGLGGHFDTISSADIADPARYAERIDHLVECARHLARKAAEQKHEFLLWEQIYAPCEIPYTIAQSKEFFARANENNGDAVPVELVIDTGHMCCQNFPHDPGDDDPYKWMKELGNITRVVHLQQCDGFGSPHWPFTPEYNAKGIIDPQRTIDTLGEAGADNCLLCFEIFFSLSQNDDQVIDALKRSVDYWRNFIEE